MKTVFLRAIEADIDDKAAALKAAIHAPEEHDGRTRYEVDAASFAVVPKSPFAYWVNERLLVIFEDMRPLQGAPRIAASGGKTLDDFRWVRCAWEISLNESADWRGFAKGGSYGLFYSDIHLVLDWKKDAAALKVYLVDYRTARGWSPNWTAELHSSEQYFRPGLTWPRRTSSGLSLRVMPAGCVFGDKGPAVFIDDNSPSALLALNAVLSSGAYSALVALQLAAADAAARSYEVGVIQRTPVPDLTPADESTLAKLARRAWSLKRQLDTINETSHAFSLPALLQVDGGNMVERAEAWKRRVAAKLEDLDTLQTEINDRCFALYSISDEDRKSIELGFGGEDTNNHEQVEAQDLAPADPRPLVKQLLSWALGVAVGRFDLRGATGERELPEEPEPFDPLPSHSPGMLAAGDPLPDAYPLSSIAWLVDDLGHKRDITSAVQAVFELVFGDNDASWNEAAGLVGGKKQDLRAFFAREFFGDHIKTYSKSRRKAPIYWQLATPSASYSIWCDLHQFDRDTFFRLLGDVVVKLDYEESKVTTLRQEAGPEPSSTQRSAIDTQECFVDELRAFRVEVERIAPLWNPNLNDGVIINFAPLWRLVAHNKSWQKECRKVWDALQAGDYDWAHWAMHLWPERVIGKCQHDRSLAIAHGLESEFWVEDNQGKWQPNTVDPKTVEELVEERSSVAVKDALKSLFEAPAPVASTRTRRASSTGTGKARIGRRASVKSRIDSSLVSAVRDALAANAEGMKKAEVRETTGLSDKDCTAAIRALIAEGTATKTGAGRSLRYHLSGEGS